MKRPEGFDRRSPEPPPRKPAKSAPASKQQAAANQPAVAKAAAAPVTKIAPPTKSKAKAPKNRPATPAAKRELKAAARERRRYERTEVKRFTRRARRRRLGWLVAFLTLLLMGGLVTGAVYSPLLSLKTITITGTSLVDQKQVHAALQDQVGKPLALVDFGEIGRVLDTFLLVRSYVTETVPPDTLIIRISERTPIASLPTSTGFSVVDAAGVVIESGTTRKAALPIIDIGTQDTKSPAFAAAVGVLLALPKDLLAKVDRVSAQTMDDVTLTLTGVGQKVVWGSPEKSDLKARVLAALVRTQDAGKVVKYDVSAPNTPVVGPA